jgi:hypothetical protein
MIQAKRSEYLALRGQYEPENVRLVMVAESPPASGKYFYDSTGSPSEALFREMMKQLGLSPVTKEAGLREFQRRGWILVDATYHPVDKLTPPLTRGEVINRDYPLLVDDLLTLTKDHRLAPLLLIKANICRLLEPKLARDGFDVLNHGRVIPFPSNGWQNKFRERFDAILKSTVISPH